MSSHPRRPRANQPRPRVNDAIRAPKVRLIDADGAQVGVVPIKGARERAARSGLDLVEVAPNATPPVVKVLDWGKFRYEQSKREREQRRNQRGQEVKQVRLRARIGEHDLQVKARQARGFVEHGHKVKVSLRFRGRESTHPELAHQLLGRFTELLGDAATVERAPAQEGRELSMLLAPAR